MFIIYTPSSLSLTDYCIQDKIKFIETFKFIILLVCYLKIRISFYLGRFINSYCNINTSRLILQYTRLGSDYGIDVTGFYIVCLACFQ